MSQLESVPTFDQATLGEAAELARKLLEQSRQDARPASSTFGSPPAESAEVGTPDASAVLPPVILEDKASASANYSTIGLFSAAGVSWLTRSALAIADPMLDSFGWKGRAVAWGVPIVAAGLTNAVIQKDGLTNPYAWAAGMAAGAAGLGVRFMVHNAYLTHKYASAEMGELANRQLMLCRNYSFRLATV